MPRTPAPHPAKPTRKTPAERLAQVEALLRQERGDLTKLDRQVARSIAHHETISTNPEEHFESARTLGEKLADAIATFGGSWTFITSFGLVLAGWITLNAGALLATPFDPFPFILLNLVLSCLAAIQAPIIMMSQNRQEAKDRLRAENDYRINLKAELEIRLLHEKLDHLILRQWDRFEEIHRIQTALLEELSPPAKPRKR